MAKDDVIEVEGTVVETLPNAMFKVELENGHTDFSCACIRQNPYALLSASCLATESWTMELSPYDLTRGRITYRFK